MVSHNSQAQFAEILRHSEPDYLVDTVRKTTQKTREQDYLSILSLRHDKPDYSASVSHADFSGTWSRTTQAQ
jgi:hypothetical protein